ncbi:MAG: transcription termination factor Rho, partial [Microthrixaceae bacterium]
MSVDMQGLERKDRAELATIAQALGGKTTSRTKKADMVKMILELSGVGPDGTASAADGGAEAPSGNGRASSGGSTDSPSAKAESASADSKQRAYKGGDSGGTDVEDEEQTGDRMTKGESGDRSGAGRRDSNAGDSSPGDSNDGDSAGDGSGARSQRERGAADSNGRNRGGDNQNQGGRNQNRNKGGSRGQGGDNQNQGGRNQNRNKGGGQNQGGDNQNQGGRNQDADQSQGGRNQDDIEPGNRRGRRRRGRNRGGQDENAGDPNWDGEPVPVQGVLDLRDDGYGFLRVKDFLPSNEDVYVSVKQVRQLGLRKGDNLEGASRPANRQEKNPAMLKVDKVNGEDPESQKSRPRFEDLTPLFPDQKLALEREDQPLDMTSRIIDLISPIGKGQRGLIVSPPKAGKTTVMKTIAQSIEANNPEVELMVLLVDERPEEVTDMRRSVKGDVIASTFDRPSEEHTMVAELTIERAKRMVEVGRDVVVILDGITRLSR